MNDEALVRALASNYWWPGADREDVEQEARIALWKARRSYDGRGSFSAFACIIIKRHLATCLRRACGRDGMRDQGWLSLPLDLPAAENVVDLVIARERLRSILDAPLHDLERHAVGRAIRGEGCSEKRLDNALQSAKRKLRLSA